LPVRWDELVASDWKAAIEKSNGTCLLPIGVLEKHGPHVPVGADLFSSQYRAQQAAGSEYVVVFPEYYFGQIFEAKYAPGTVAYPPKLIWDLLQATLDEIARNGFKKIVIYSTHGGNPHWLRYQMQAQLEKPRDYVVYLYDPKPDPEFNREHLTHRKTPLKGDEHAGERETATNILMRPDLVKLERANDEDWRDQNRLEHLPDFWTGVSWYARFPNHYAGDGSKATVELGRWWNDSQTKKLAEALRKVKDDSVAPQVQEENYRRQLK
jgi:creatinine amidohydrolase